MNIYGSWKFNCVFNRYIFRTLFSNKIISTPLNINGNISYEGILKRRTYRKWSFSVVFLIKENGDEGITISSDVTRVQGLQMYF